MLERIVVLQPPGADLNSLRLVDRAGDDVPFEVVETRFIERFWGVDYRHQLYAEEQRAKLRTYLDQFGDRIVRPADEAKSADTFLTIRFLADLPALGHACFRLRDDRVDAAAVPPRVRLSDDCLENETLRVRLRPDGRFDLTDKRNGRSYDGLNLFEDGEDIGDEYDWSPARNGTTHTSAGCEGRVRAVGCGALSGSLETSFEWPLPAALAPDRESRSEATETCRVQVRVSLHAGRSLVDVETRFDNRVCDHRLRAVFPTGLAAGELVSDGHFMVHRRSLERPGGEDWVQPPPSTFPQQEFSALESDGRGLALFVRGLPEIEAQRTDRGTAMHLTMLRSVGWLSRDDFPTRRRCNAGPTLATPAAQCLGEQRFRYAILPYEGDWIEAGVPREARLWRVRPPSVQGVVAGHAAGGADFLRLASKALRVTAIKRHETRDTLVVRLHNMTAARVEEEITLGLPVTKAWRVSLLEQREERLESRDRTVRLDVAAYRIVTLEIEFDR